MPATANDGDGDGARSSVALTRHFPSALPGMVRATSACVVQHGVSSVCSKRQASGTSRRPDLRSGVFTYVKMGDLCIYYMEHYMNIKSLVLIGLFANFLSPSVGNTAALENGLRTNGLTLNGLTLNGLTFNGFRFNGISWNGRAFNGIGASGSSETRGIALDKVTVKLPPR
jgi:hypothetical protein